MKRTITDISEEPNFGENKKIILIGDSSTGKSSFFSYLKNLYKLEEYKFKKTYNATDNFDLSILKLKTNMGNTIIELWDTAGQESKGEIRNAYIKGADGVLLFYDISEKKTVENISKWLNQIKKIAPNIPVAVIGNKSDKFPNIQQAESVKIRECNLQRDIGHSNIKNFMISIKENSHLEFNITGILFTTLTIVNKNGCLNSLEYVLSTIYNKNIVIV